MSGVRRPPLEPFERRKIAPTTGLGALFEHQKTFAHTPLPRGFRDMFRYVLERSFDDSFTIFTIFEKCAFMIFSDFLDIRKNATHFFPHFPARARANASANTPQALLNLYWPLQGRLRDVKNNASRLIDQNKHAIVFGLILFVNVKPIIYGRI